MAVSIVASLSKKMPIAGQDYAMRQVGVTISGEVTDLARVPEEAARLLALAESAVDQKLGLVPNVLPASPAIPASPASPQERSGLPPASPAPYPSTNGRRAPAAISAAQLRFVRQLCDRNPGAFERIAADHKVGSLEELTSRAASGLIDKLQGASR